MTTNSDRGAVQLRADMDTERSLRGIAELVLPAEPEAITTKEMQTWTRFLGPGGASLVEDELVARFRDRLRARHRMALRPGIAVLRAKESGQDARKLLGADEQPGG